MKKVRDRLYIGNIKDAAEVLTSPNPPVTHMLSLITPNMDPLEYKKSAAAVCDEKEHHCPLEVVDVASVEVDKLVRKIEPIRDIESQNLLDHLEACLEFIEKGRSEGEILVHCVAGVSRSAAVITAYLMRLDRCKVDAVAVIRGNGLRGGPKAPLIQEIPSGESGWRRRGSRRWGGEDDDPACTSLFVEPIQWMSSVQDGVYEGKLQCLNCEARLGSFNWAGIQCSCGTRVTPAFQLHKCHMDSSLTVNAESSEEPTRYPVHSEFSTTSSTRLCGHLLV